MAVTQVTTPPIEMYGLSTDTKPTSNVPVGSTFYETDTKTNYVYSGSAWGQKS